MLLPILYLFQTCDIPAMQAVTVASFAEINALMGTEKDRVISTDKFQKALNSLLR